MEKFPANYYDVKEIFASYEKEFERKWDNLKREKISLPTFPELSIDYLIGEPKEKRRMIVLSSGLHGIEGLVGSRIVKFFVKKFLNTLNSNNTGLTIIDTINPFGLKYERKVNENNVDLNRNFIWHWEEQEGLENPDLENPDYEDLRFLLNPPTISNYSFITNLIKAMKNKGSNKIKKGVTLGQYKDEKGVYYGGKGYQYSTLRLIELYNFLFANYEELLFLDLHTGYGPKDRLLIVNSPYEKISRSEWQKRFSYQDIVQTTEEEFYAINGDMINYLYMLQREKFPQVKLYATTLEFGTLGDSLLAEIESLKITIEENYLFHQKIEKEKSDEKRRKKIRRLYAPNSLKWQQTSLANAEKVFTGILTWFLS